MLSLSKPPQHNGVNRTSHQNFTIAGRSRKQRVTITLPAELLERLRNAVYWTGHGTLARLIADALDDSVTQMEEANGQVFPQRLSPLKRGRPRTKTDPTSTLAASITSEPGQ